MTSTVSNMESMKENFEVLAARYLSGEMDAEELSRFEKTLAEQPEWSASLNELQLIWAAAEPQGGDSAQGEWDVDTAWQRFDDVNPLNTGRKRISMRVVFAIAAGILLVVIGSVWLFSNREAPLHFAYDPGRDGPVELADGSKVYLNTGASLEVSPFSGQLRKVKLKGEAYFEITSEPSRPFHVNCGQTLTEVVGTSFNLREKDGQVHIYVSSGKIIFSLTDSPDKAVALKAGESAESIGNAIRQAPVTSPNALAWHTRQLQFKRMPLSQVVADIGAYFNRPLVIENDQIAQCRITIPRPFSAPDIDSVVEAVAIAIQATVVTKGDTLIIMGGNCHE